MQTALLEVRLQAEDRRRRQKLFQTIQFPQNEVYFGLRSRTVDDLYFIDSPGLTDSPNVTVSSKPEPKWCMDHLTGHAH